MPISGGCRSVPTTGATPGPTSPWVSSSPAIRSTARLEGPFGEYPGYYMPPDRKPVFRLKAVTHRRDAIYLAGLTGKPTTDNHVFRQISSEAILYDRLRQICPTIRDICVTDAGGGNHVVISIKPTFATQARDVMLAAFNTERIRPKLVT